MHELSHFPEMLAVAEATVLPWGLLSATGSLGASIRRIPLVATVCVIGSESLVMTILQNNGAQSTGDHRINFDASKLEPGIYFCKIETDDYTIVKRIIHSN